MLRLSFAVSFYTKFLQFVHFCQYVLLFVVDMTAMVQTQKQRRKGTELRKLTANLKGKWRSVQVHNFIVFNTLRSGVAIFNGGLHAYHWRLLVFTFYVSCPPSVLFLLSDSFSLHYFFFLFAILLAYFLWFFFGITFLCMCVLFRSLLSREAVL